VLGEHPEVAEALECAPRFARVDVEDLSRSAVGEPFPTRRVHEKETIAG
jgi:hypothetical protein